MDPLLLLQRVSFAYAQASVLVDIDLSLSASEVLCLLGPNGAGKSTLIKIVCGTVRPSTGAVTLAEHLRPQHVGLVPQDVALFPLLTAAENCRAFARFSGLRRSDVLPATDQAMALTGCTDIADVPVRRLSGGYRRRVNIAAALVARPRILILDEPTVGIDLEARTHIGSIIRRLRDEGMAILLVTHDFVEADAVAERLAFLASGRVVACDRPAALLAHTFGHAKRIEIILPEPPDEAARGSLLGLGAAPGNDGVSWHAFGDIDGWNADVVAQRLAEDGVVFSELRLRTPGAEALYGYYCGTAS